MNLNEVRQESLPIEFDLHRIINGSGWSFQFYITDDNDDRMDLTGYTVEMTIKDKPNGKTFFELTDTEGHVVITAATGLIDVWLSTADTASIDVHNLIYRIDLIDGSERTTILSGNIPVAWR